MTLLSLQPGRWLQLLLALMLSTLLVACGGGGSGDNPPGSPPATSFKLTLDVVGSGRVQSQPEGLDCTTSCVADFARNAPVTLTATPADGQLFAGWSGACTNASSTCVVTMDQAQAVTAAFTSLTGQSTYTFSVTVQGGGTVVSQPAGIDCGVICRADFAADTVVTLTATPAAGQSFSGWSGACTGAGSTCNVRLDRTATAAATFVPVTGSNFDLSVAVTGNGAVDSNPAGIACGSVCTANFAVNTAVTLTATPGADQVFSSWGGACTGAAPTCTLQLTQLRSVQATFSVAPPVGVAFQPAQLLETNNDFNVAAFSRVAVNSNGDALVIWEQSDGVPDGNTYKVYSRRYTAATGWQPAVVIAGLTRREGNPSNISGRLLMDDAGIATWMNADTQTRRNSPTTGWGAMFAAPNPRVSQNLSSAVMDAAGNIGVLRSGDDVQSNSLLVGASSWGVWQDIDTAGPLRATDAQLALSSNGTALAVWRESNPGDSEYSVKSARLLPGVGWGAPQSIEGLFTSVPAQLLKIAMDDQGNGIAMWAQGNGGNDVVYNIYRAGSGWQGEVVVPQLPDLLRSINSIQLAMTGDGRALATWEAGGGDGTLRSMQYRVATGWTAPVRVTEAARLSEMRISNSGQAVIIHTTFDRATAKSDFVSRSLTFDGQWSAPTSLKTGVGGTSFASFVMNKTGQGVALWRQNDVDTTGSRVSLQAAVLR